MPLLEVFPGIAPSPVEIVRDFMDGRVRVRFVNVPDSSEWTVPSHLLLADERDSLSLVPTPPQGRLTERQAIVLQALANAGYNGMTDDEHEAVNGMRGDSAGKRRLELCRYGYVATTDHTRPTKRGGSAIVWQITNAGMEALHAHRRQTHGAA